jgi:hypothetical protein
MYIHSQRIRFYGLVEFAVTLMLSKCNAKYDDTMSLFSARFNKGE